MNCSARIRASWASAGRVATLTDSKPPTNAARKGATPLRRIVRRMVCSFPLLGRSDARAHATVGAVGRLCAIHANRPRKTSAWSGESDALPSARLRTPPMGDESTFADLLRRHRAAAGLTQQELAERAGLSLRGLSDIERGLRRAPHRDTVLRLAEALHLDEVDAAALRRASRRRGTLGTVATFPPIRPTAALPVPLSRFIGRDRELPEVRQRLVTNGLLTLTGPPGSGKTRLALQLALDVSSAFPDGIVFVPLAAIRDPELAGSTIAQALGIRDLSGWSLVQRLIEYLHNKSLLLVLDNFEQVLAAGPLVSKLLTVDSGVKVLGTSREPLRIQGEHEFMVPPLALPQSNEPLTLEALTQYGAIALFVDRAAAIRPDFGLSDNNAHAVVEICRRLDGLPLAIELAAARIRLLSPQELLKRLDHRFSPLTDGTRDLPARQQTLRAMIDWSYDLLDSGEQALLRQLSIFVGGCTLQAAEAVAGAEDADLGVLDEVSSLVAKGLLRQEVAPTGETRVGMLETIREYGFEQLETRGELVAARLRHASFYLALAEEAEPKLLTGEQVQWVRRLEVEYDNLRAVMAWSRDGIVDDEIGLRLTGALAWFWVLSGVAWEARGWVEIMLALPAASADTLARARALHAAARVAIVQDDATAARIFGEESALIFSTLGDEAGLGRALAARGAAESMDADYHAARSSLERSLTLAKQVADAPGLAFALGQLGAVAQYQGDYQLSRSLREESAEVARQIGDRHSLGIALTGLAHLARLQSDFHEAAALLHKSLLLGTELGASWRVVPRALNRLAGLTCDAGDYLRSACLLGAAGALWDAS